MTAVLEHRLAETDALRERQRALLDYWFDENPGMAEALQDAFERTDELPAAAVAWGMVCAEGQVACRRGALRD